MTAPPAQAARGDDVIAVRDLTFTYQKGTKPAVRGLTFHIDRGEIFGFLGPSGAGKSTTQRILIGLLGDYEGSTTVLGKDVDAWASDYYDRIGVSFEFPNHYLKLTARENLTYFGSLYGGATAAPEALLAAVGLTEDVDVLVSQFSKGMKNRLSVARALLNDPEVLFLDEPTAGLDPLNARRIKDLIKAQKRAGKTIFLTTHDMTVADELCDRVAFIVAGEIKVIDAPHVLKRRHGHPVIHVEYEKDGTYGDATFPLEQLGTNADFVALLREYRVQTIHTLEATLETVFIEVTGRGLE